MKKKKNHTNHDIIISSTSFYIKRTNKKCKLSKQIEINHDFN